MNLREIRKNALAAYVGPFVLYSGLQQIKNWVKVENPQLPWWKSAPEHWVYPLQTVLCLALLAWWWPRYTFRPSSARTLWTGVWVGVLGLILWVLPAELFRRYGWENEWLGMVSRTKPGYDPTVFPAGSLASSASLGMRFLRLVIMVPIMEELVMRGFLWRYLTNSEVPFTTLPFGLWHRLGVLGSILAFTVGHQTADLLGCLSYGVLISYVAWRTRSLAACIVCHAVTNLLLGGYVMQTQQWGFW